MAPPTPDSSLQEAYQKGATTPNTTTLVASPTSDPIDKARPCCTPLVIANTCIGLGAILIVFGIVYATAMPAITNKSINDGVVSCSQSDYAKPKFIDSYGDCDDCNPFVYYYYPYNVTNAPEVLQGAKLQLHELGPYAYRKRFLKKNVRFDGSTVSYRAFSTWSFDVSKSCSGCSPTDPLTVFDLGYLGIMSGAAGEYNFLKTLLKSMSGAAKETDTSIATKIQLGGATMLKLLYGYNSLNPQALQNLGTKALVAVAQQDLMTLMGLQMEGFDYNGIFSKRTVQQAATGYPSLLAGSVLGKNYLENCVKAGINDKCASCRDHPEQDPDQCAAIGVECGKCAKGQTVMEFNQKSCDQIEALYASAFGANEASQFVNGTCRMCALTGFCAAQMPGAMEKTGFLWSADQEPPLHFQTKYIQTSGCHDKDLILDFEMYNNNSATALFAVGGSRPNPTAMELAAFHGNCNSLPSSPNYTCVPVSGSDGSAMKPSGVGLSGMPSSSDVHVRDIFVSAAYQNVSVYATNERYKVRGIDVVRFRALNDVLKSHPWNAHRGTGIPFAGVQPLSYVYGFLSYLSMPHFIWGDQALLDNIDVTSRSGEQVTFGSMYEQDGNLKNEVRDLYATFVDVEPATGKSLRVTNRCQASIAMNKSPQNASWALSDVLHPKVQTEVVWPLYWGEESVVVTRHNADKFKRDLVTLTKSFLPVFLVAVIGGSLVLAFGVFWRVCAVRAIQSEAKHSSGLAA